MSWGERILSTLSECGINQSRTNGAILTKHFADVRLDVHVLQVLVRVSVVQPQCRVQSY